MTTAVLILFVIDLKQYKYNYFRGTHAHTYNLIHERVLIEQALINFTVYQD